MISNFEFITKKIFTFLLPNEQVIYNTRPDWLKFKTGNNLELDIFYPQLKLAIEVNGFSHQHNFQKERDKFKRKRCRKKGIFLLNINNFSDLFIEQNRNLLLNNFKIDVAALPSEILQKIADYEPKKIPGLANKIIWKAKIFKKNEIQRKKRLENKIKNKINIKPQYILKLGDQR